MVVKTDVWNENSKCFCSVNSFLRVFFSDFVMRTERET